MSCKVQPTQRLAKNIPNRTLTFATDSMDRLEESSANFADDVSKYISKQKKAAVMGLFTGKFL